MPTPALDPATTVAAATSPVCSAVDTTAAAKVQRDAGESPAPMVSATSCTNAGLRATYPSPSSKNSPIAHARDRRRFDSAIAGNSAGELIEGECDGGLISGQADGVVDAEHIPQPGALLPRLEQVTDRGDRVPPLLQPGDPLEPPHMGLVVEPDPTDPGRGVQDLPGLVLPDRAHRSTRARRELLDPEACLGVVISLRVSHLSTLPANTVTVNTVTNMNATDTSTTGQLLETLRQVTGRPRLDFAAPPSPLAGGFYAEMLRLRLADPPAALDRDLVARIVPNPAAGAWEATVQRQVAQQGFATPTVRLTAPETSPLGRYLIVMDHIDGRPPMAGLGIGTIARQIPNLVRHLPDQLARIAAELHALDPEALDGQLDALDSSIPTTISGFVAELTGYAATLGRPDIAAAGQRLLATEPRTSVRSITHGDLHPFNLLVTADGPVLIDWTVARIAHPAFTLGFAELMLANPPIPLPRAGAALLGPVARNIAKRFLTTYRALTAGTPAAVDDENLDWHRRVHALRILVELAGWDASGTRPTSGHPWLILEPVARQSLALGPS